jgi:RNA polymerase sigma factor (sigma-70 family)
MIDIVSVGNQKVSYKDHSDIQFEPLSFYLELAQKTISKFSGMFSNNLSKEMLKSEDAIASVANCIMMADWRWDENREGETGKKKTRYSYRNQCAIWAIKSYLSRKKNKRKLRQVESSDEETNLLDIMYKDGENPIDLIINNEEQNNLRNYLADILSADTSILTNKQVLYIKLYYFDNLTYAEIGKQFGVTREAVRQGIKKAIEKIQKLSECKV